MIKLVIIEKINNFIDNLSLYESLDGIFNYLVKHNVLSIDIHDIVNERKNKKKFMLSSLKTLYVMLMSFYFIPFLLSDKLINLFDNPIIPIDKQFIGLMFCALFFTVIFRIDILIGEKRFNLTCLKFIYYLMINDQLKHKLNDHNYKTLKIIAKISHYILIQIGHRFILFVIFSFVVLSIISKLSFFIICSPLFYAFFINLTTDCGLLCLTINILAYHIIRFSQINTQLRLYHRVKSNSFISINRLINEHNQLSLSIHQINIILNRTLAYLFIILAFIIDLAIYLLISSKSIYYKLLFLCILLLTLTIVLTFYILLIKLTNSAHQCHNLIYSLIQRQTISYRTRLKVTNTFK